MRFFFSLFTSHNGARTVTNGFVRFAEKRALFVFPNETVLSCTAFGGRLGDAVESKWPYFRGFSRRFPALAFL